MISKDQTSLSYVPIKRYEGRRNSILSSAYAGLYEIIMNLYGEKSVYPIEKQSGESHLDGRGDVHHRNGGFLSVPDHNTYVNKSDTLRLENNKYYGKWISKIATAK